MKDKITRKKFFKAGLITVAIAAMSGVWGMGRLWPKLEKTGEVEAKASSDNSKILILFFSHSGNTREMANQIHGITGGDIVEIKTVNNYPANYDAVVKKAKEELSSGYKPKLRSTVNNIDAYDVIFIGYPNWWGTIPMALVTFLSENKLSGKRVVPFCTHEGSGLGSSVKDIKKLAPDSIILEGLAVRGRSVDNAQNNVLSWLRKIGMSNQ